MARLEWSAAARLWTAHFAGLRGRVLDIGAGNGEFWRNAPPPEELILGDIAGIYRNGAGPGMRLVFDAVQPPIAESGAAALVALGVTEYIPDLPAALRAWRAIVPAGGGLLVSSSPPILPNLLRRLADRSVIVRSDALMTEMLLSGGWQPAAEMPQHAGWQSLFVAWAG